MRHLLIVATALLGACGEQIAPTDAAGPGAAVDAVSLARQANPKRPVTTIIVYDNFQKPGGYTLADYNEKGSVSLGEMTIEETRRFDNHTFAIPGHVVHGTYVQSGAPYAARVLEGQQTAATLSMADFVTGQVFDWYMSGNARSRSTSACHRA